MKLAPRGALRAVTATAAAVALTLVVAAPSLATSATDTIVVDPAADLGALAPWAPLEAPALTSDETEAEFAQRIIAEIAADPDSGAASALAGEELPAGAASVLARFADAVPDGATVLSGTSERALVAYADGVATVVYANDSAEAGAVEIDLRSFSEPSGARLVTHSVAEDGAAVVSAPVPVAPTGVVSAEVPGSSVVSFVVSGLQTVPEAPQEAAAAPAALGEGVPMLLESAYAGGKTLELANPRAQQTGPAGATYTAPAAVFSIGRTGPVVQAQAPIFYPVVGAEKTYVIAAADGRVLVRRDNAAADFRYLDLRTMSLDEAAADPYAQWIARDAGDGAVYLHNAKLDGAGQTAALDLYNWRTDETAEVQTYTSGTAAVQKWHLRSLQASVDTLTEVVEIGATPTLPTRVRAAYSWGPRVALTDLAWQLPASDVWQSEGVVTVTGTGTGFFGEPVAVTAAYTVGALDDDIAAAMSTFAGAHLAEVKMRAPRSIARAVSGTEQSVTSPVTWDWSRVADADFAEPGTVTVPAASVSGFTATLTIDVRPSEQVNILRGPGVHHDYTHMNGSQFALTDGVRDVPGFDDWRSGGAANRVNPNTVTFSFDEPRQVTGASVYDIGGRNNVGGVTVQYRDLIGGWIDLPAGDTVWPVVNREPALRLEVDSTPVVATAVRVIITNKTSDTWMSLSEVEVHGPAVSAR